MKDIRGPDYVDNWTRENHLTKDRPWQLERYSYP